MAMLRVSSYRKLFEEDGWSRNGGTSGQCAGQYRAPARAAASDDCDCDKLDFVAASALNKEGLSRFVQERTVMAALNDRLVRLIELARCFEEENESLECQIAELEEQQSAGASSSRLTSVVAVQDYSLDAVVDRLRRERDETLRHTEELCKELERLMKECEMVGEQRLFVEQDRQDVAQEVDAVTAECLALREQVCIYEEQLANMEAQHSTSVDSLLDPAEGPSGAMAVVNFCSPDLSPALDLKGYYCRLAQDLELECGAVCASSSSSSVVPSGGNGKQLEAGGAAGSRDLSKMDTSEIKALISELEKELAELEKCNEELEDEVETKRAEYMEEIAELQCTIEEMRHQEVDFRMQMKEQCEDYKELLSEKMARDMEIAAYRGLVEEEEERLCCM